MADARAALAAARLVRELRKVHESSFLSNEIDGFKPRIIDYGDNKTRITASVSHDRNEDS